MDDEALERAIEQAESDNGAQDQPVGGYLPAAFSENREGDQAVEIVADQKILTAMVRDAVSRGIAQGRLIADAEKRAVSATRLDAMMAFWEQFSSDKQEVTVDVESLLEQECSVKKTFSRAMNFQPDRLQIEAGN